MSNDFQSVLRRIQTDFDFYNRMLVDPESALKNFKLTPDQKNTLIRNRQILFRHLVPAPSGSPLATTEKKEEEPEPEPGPVDLGLPQQFIPGPLDPPLGPPDVSPPNPEPSPPGPPEPPDLSNFIPSLVPQPPDVFKAPPIPINFLSGLAGLLPFGREPSVAMRNAVKTVRSSKGDSRKRALRHLLKTLDGRAHGKTT